ncbi:alpha/beta hydrolase [Steroidobacter denitrificans]|uniref:alpha/beta hydrolase n=1 Tax=Steroidobacter denitrificans TaxID=465721 RepID=UPI0009F8831D|nr:alpha/beta hydrolase [Steroidobacter denitrificans]
MNSIGVKVENRLLPFSRSISQSARIALEQCVSPDGTPLNKKNYPDHNDFVGWQCFIKALDVNLDHMVQRYSANLTAEIKTTEIAGCTVHIATPKNLISGTKIYLDIHGGALISGSGNFCKWGARRIAETHGVRCYAVDYRMPPTYPYPAPLDDCLAVYRNLIGQFGAENLIVGGASAGGNLAAALMLRARDEGLPLPASLVLLTPELDLTESGDSFEVNVFADVILCGSLMPANQLYANGYDLGHPHVSPLFGSFTKGFPPTFLQTGTRDLFLSNAVRMHRALRRAAVTVELHVFEGMPHGVIFGSPEAEDLEEELKRFVTDAWM